MICLLDAQSTITDKGGTMRLGAQQASLERQASRQCYGKTEISERHRHRYEFNNRYRDQFTAHGMLFSGTSPDNSLVEVIELPEHPWFLAVQYHPEFKSSRRAAAAVCRIHRRGGGKKAPASGRRRRSKTATNSG